MYGGDAEVVGDRGEAAAHIPNGENGAPSDAAISLVTPAKAGAHKHRPLEYGPRLSPG